MNLSATNELLDKSFGWNAIIVVSTLLFSLIFACATPFAAMAGLAALHLSRKQGLSVILAAWLINQIIGYGLLDYPQTWDSFAWGAMIALAGLSAAVIERIIESTYDIGERGEWRKRQIALRTLQLPTIWRYASARRI